ncbi:hypothetical protein Bbelb_296800 [Branchiostoma belcheri]|nr:hypothetical protein Bbelb_296800 [Branchiostoma belcheri]
MAPKQEGGWRLWLKTLQDWHFAPWYVTKPVLKGALTLGSPFHISHTRQESDLWKRPILQYLHNYKNQTLGRDPSFSRPPRDSERATADEVQQAADELSVTKPVLKGRLDTWLTLPHLSPQTKIRPLEETHPSAALRVTASEPGCPPQLMRYNRLRMSRIGTLRCGMSLTSALTLGLPLHISHPAQHRQESCPKKQAILQQTRKKPGHPQQLMRYNRLRMSWYKLILPRKLICTFICNSKHTSRQPPAPQACRTRCCLLNSIGVASEQRVPYYPVVFRLIAP